MDLEGLKISDNSAEYGGGMSILQASLDPLFGATLEYNSASKAGGGIWNAGRLTIQDLEIVANRSGGDGGGIFSRGPIRIERCSIRENIAEMSIETDVQDPRSAATGGGLHHVIEER